METVANLGEDPLIGTLIQGLHQRSDVLVGPGDDCAVLSNQTSDQTSSKSGPTFTLLKTDTVIEGVHYLPDSDPYWVGWKAVARVVSDFAAMAGRPQALVIALAIKPDTAVDYLKRLYNGINACAKQYNFSVVGGETSSSSTNVITVSGTGLCDQYVTRSNAKVADYIYVTGHLGNSISGKHLTFSPRVEEAAWIQQNLQASAMMDLSDGISKDLNRLADLSRVGFDLDLAAIPCNPSATVAQALADGEDYELLFSSPQALTEELTDAWHAKFPQLALTKIGSVTESSRTKLAGGWEHFTTAE